MTGRQPHRVHIIGGPGSGKTTLARRIAARMGAPAFDLDFVGYEGGAGPERPLEARLSAIRSITSRRAWVTEGIFLGWTDELLRAADLIVWLDLPWRVAGWRILRRHIRRSIGGNNPHRGLRKLARFLLWARTYYTSSLPAPAEHRDSGGSSNEATRALIALYLHPYSHKLVRCSRPSSVRALLARLE